MLATTAAFPLMLAANAAYADGAGGANSAALGGSSGINGGAGGGGGVGGVGGSNANSNVGAGGNGTAAGAGGAGSGGNAITLGDSGGAGGAGGSPGTASSPTGGNGGAGGTGSCFTCLSGFGGGGGGGGGDGFVGATLGGVSGAITGGSGGNGGTPSAAGASGADGGGGGGAGAGAVLSGTSGSSTSTSANVTGGNGGAGGGSVGAGGAGFGGGGGSGIVDTNVNLANSFSITGGNGGAGGNGANANEGRIGGAGGAGVTASSLTLTNTGTIQGGRGGTTGANPAAGTVAAAGGAGVQGSSLQIVNGGTIAGGLSGDGVTRANAITFTSGTNSLQLQQGWNFVGNVVTSSGATSTLILGGNTTDLSSNAAGTSVSTVFSLPQIGTVFQGFSSFQKTGSSTWVLIGSTSASTPWNISAGTLQLGDGTTNGSITGNVVDNATLAFDPAASTTIANAGTISGTGAVQQIGAGTTVLTAANTYTGGTTISAGTLQLGDGTTNGSITGNVTDNATLAFDPAASTTITHAGVISGSGSVQQIGAGTTVLTAANTYSGGTTISAGTLQLGDGTTNGSITGNVTDNATLAFDPAASTTITNAGVISGAGAVQQTGTGTTVLTAANTYTGGTTISAGTLQLGDGTTNGSITGNVTDNATLAFDPAAATTIANPAAISGAGVVQQIGAGTTVLTAANTYTGATTISAGTLQLGDGTSNGSIAGNVTDNATLAFDPAAGTTIASPGVISGAGVVQQIGAGTTVLSGVNTYAGGTTIDAGTLQVSADDNLGASAGALTLDGGTLSTTASFASSRAATLDANGGTFDVGGSTTLTMNGVIAGAGALTKTDTGTLLLTGANTYAGGTTISGGTLQLGDGTTNGSITGNVTDNATLVFDPAASTTMTDAGVISGSGSVQQIGTGTTVFTAANTYSGGTTISAGTLQLGDGTTNGSITGNVTDNATLAFDPAASTTITNAGAISGAGIVQQIGAGTTVLSSTNTYSGGTTISDGTLQLTTGTAAGTGAVAVNTTAGDTTQGLNLDFASADTFANTLAGSGVTTVAAGSGTATVTGSNSGYSGNWQINGSAAVAPSSTTSTTNLGAGTVNIASGGSLAATTAGAFSFDNALTGSGTLSASNGGGAFSFGSGAGSAFQGTVALSNDTFALAGTNTAALTNATLSLGAGNVTTVGDGNQAIGALTFNGGTAAFDGTAPAQQVATSLITTGSLNVSGTGTVQINVPNPYTPPTPTASGNQSLFQQSHVNNGLELVSAASVTGDASGLTLEDQNGTPLTAAQNVNIAQGGNVVAIGSYAYSLGTGSANNGLYVDYTLNQLALQAGQSLTLTEDPGATGDNADMAAQLTGAGNLVIAANNVVSLSNTGNTFTGATTVRSGTLQANAANVIASSGAVDIDAGSTFNTNGFSQSVDNLTGAATANLLLSGGDTLTLNGSGTPTTFAGTIAGAGSLAQASGTEVLTGANTYTGGTTISGGTLQLGDGTTNGSITGDITDNATLAFDPAASTTMTEAGVISGSGAVQQIGAGTTTLTGTSTYSGGTMISAGTLQLGDGSTNGSITGNVTDNATLAFDPAAGTTLANASAISGAGQITQIGSGTTNLTGDSGAFSGTASVTSGSLQVGGTLGGGASTVNVSSGGTLGGSGTIGGNVNIADGTLAPGNVDFGGGPGTLAIGGNLALTSASTLEYHLGQANVVGGPSNDLTTVGGNLTLAGTVDVTTPVGSFDPGLYRIISYNGTLTDNGLTVGSVTAGSAVTVQTSIAGDVNLVNTSGSTPNFWDGGASAAKNNGAVDGGDGIWQSSAGNDNWTTETGALNAPYPDGTFAIFAANSGTVTVDDSPGAVISGGMQFATNGYVITGNPVTMAAGTDLIRVGDGTSAGAGYVATIASQLTGSGGIDKDDLGTLVLTGANTYTGGTTISGGTLQLGDGTTNGSVTGDITDNATLAFDPAASTTIANAGAISGTGQVQQIGAGTTVLTAANTYTGGTTISAGTLQLGDGTTNGSVAGDITDNATLAFDPATGTTTTNAGTISGTGAVEQTGAGTTVLTAANSYAGGTTISAGTLQLGDGTTNGSITGNVTDNATLAFDPAASTTITNAGVISGAGQVTQIGTGTTVLTAANTYTGGTTIGAGTLQLGDGTTNGSIAGDVTDNATLAFDPAAGTTITTAGAISGTGVVMQTGAGIAVLSGANSYTGGTTIDAGTLQVSSDGNLGAASGALTIDGGTLNTAASFTSSRATTLGASGGTFDVDSGTTLTLSGAISGAGALTKTDAGTLLLTTANSYAGGTTISAGTLQLGDGTTNGSITGDIADNATLAFDPATGTTTTTAGTISGTGALQQIGAGTTVLSGANSYAGGTTIEAGTLQVSSDGNLGAASGALTIDGGTLNTTASFASSRATTLGTNGGTFDVDSGTTLTLGSAISGAGALTKTDAGTLLLTAANSYAGGTTISAGTLQLGDGTTNGSISGDIADNGTLAFDPASGTTLTEAGAITGAGQIRQTGAGTTNLTGDSSAFSGPATVSAGSLTVSGTLGNAGSTVSVASGGTLGGGGTIGGNVSVADGALAPGNTSVGGGPGTLTIGGDLALSSASALDYHFGQTNVAGGPLNDLTAVSGNLTLAGTLNVSLSPAGSFDPGIYRIISYGGTLTNDGLALGALPAGTTESVQTSIAGEVNLVNSTGVATNFWDGAGSARNDGVIEGGNGVWQSPTGNDNWAGANGAFNAPYTNGSFAIFSAAPGTVTVDDSLGNVVSGGMQFATSGYLIQGDPITMAAGSNLIRVGDGTSAGAGYVATIASPLTGSGGIDKADLGTLVLAGANGYTGGTTVGAGTLRLQGAGTLGATSGATTVAGGTLDLGGTSQTQDAGLTLASGAVNDGTLSSSTGFALQSGSVGASLAGGGALGKTGSGTVTLTGNNTYTGATTVSGGTLALGSGGSVAASSGVALAAAGATFDTSAAGNQTIKDLSSVAGSTVNVGANTLAFGTANPTTFAGSFAGTGGLNWQGSGTFSLTGDSSGFAGTTTIDAGAVAIGTDAAPNASLGGDVDVRGGMLKGFGTIGGNLVNTGGTVQPGGSIGTLTAGGNYTQSAGGTLAIQVSPTAASQLKVGGAATIDGKLALLFAPGTYNPASYKLLTAQSVGGTFAQVSGTNPSGLTQSIDYNPADVTLRLGNPASSGSPPSTGTPTVVAPTNDTIYTTLTSMALLNAQQMNGIILDRIGQRRAGIADGPVAGLGDPSMPVLSADTSGNAPTALSPSPASRGAWFRGIGNFTSLSGRAGVPGFTGSTGGFMLGYDQPVNDNTYVGAAAGYLNSSIDEHSSSSGTLQSARVALYGGVVLGPSLITATAGYAHDWMNTARGIAGVGTASESHGGDEATFAGQWSMPLTIPGLAGGSATLTPKAGVQYVHLSEGAFAETGAGAFDLGANGRGADSFQPYFGFAVSQHFTTRGGTEVTPELRVGYAYETLSNARRLSVFTADGTAFPVSGIPPSRNQLTAGLGLTMTAGPNLSFYASYDAILPVGNTRSQTFQAGLRWKF